MNSFLALALPGLIAVSSPAVPPTEMEARTSINLRLDAEKRAAEMDKAMPSLELPPLKERLVPPPTEKRFDSFQNSRVDIAPKSWPFPMVTSPGRPVLPGSAW